MMGSVTEAKWLTTPRFGSRRSGADERRGTVGQRATSGKPGTIGAAADRVANPWRRAAVLAGSRPRAHATTR